MSKKKSGMQYFGLTSFPQSPSPFSKKKIKKGETQQRGANTHLNIKRDPAGSPSLLIWINDYWPFTRHSAQCKGPWIFFNCLFSGTDDHDQIQNNWSFFDQDYSNLYNVSFTGRWEWPSSWKCPITKLQNLSLAERALIKIQVVYPY